VKQKNKFNIYKLLSKDFRYKPDMTETKGKPFHYDITLDLEGFPLKFNGISGNHKGFHNLLHEEETAFRYARNMMDYATTLLKELDKHGYKLEGYLVEKDENDPVYSDKLPPRPFETYSPECKPIWTVQDNLNNK